MRTMNKKNFVWVLAVMGVVSVLIFAGGSRVDADYFYESREHLDDSLTNLKESVHKALGKNRWLKEDSQRLRSEIEVLRSEYQKFRLEATQLRAKYDSLAVNLSTEARRLKLANQEYRRLQQSMDYLTSEEEDLQQRLGAADEDFKKFREETIFLEQHIVQMKGKLLAINDEKKTVKRYKKRRQELLGVLQESEKKAKKAKMKLNKIERKYALPLAMMNELTANQNTLTQGIKDEEKRVKALTDQEKLLLEEIDNVDNFIQNEIVSLQKEIQDQKREKKELEGILEKAQLKIKKHDIKIKAKPSGPNLLKKNLMSLRNENERLNKEISVLEGSLNK